MTHALLVPNGTTALSAALAAVGVSPGGRVSCPALACWTLTSAIMACGTHPVYVDVDHTLAAVPPPSVDATIAVLPWGGNLVEAGTQGDTPVVADASVSLYADGLAHRNARAMIISMGPGKPAARRAGGALLLTADDEVRRGLLLALRHYRSSGRWTVAGPRLTLLDEDPADAVAHVNAIADRRDHAVADFTAAASVFTAATHRLTAPRLRATSVSTLVPLFVDPEVPVPAKDLVRVAQAHGLGLDVQPVTPPYQEPAITAATGTDNPRAESYAERLVFALAARDGAEGHAADVAGMLDAVVATPDDFRRPYRVPDGPDTVPAALAGRDLLLGRRLDGRFVATDQQTGARFAVPDAVAGSLQQRGA